MIGPEFFPTPPSVARLMLEKVSREATNFLEPSAGRGDLADAIHERRNDRYGRRVNIDVIESDPTLAAALDSKEHVKVVGYDWLTYTGVSFYDAIIMNPPFSNGDEHLLKAWDFMHDGEIVCLLNEETILNPYTASRQRLAKVIAEHGSVDYLGNCFSRSDRPTDVRVALVYLRKKADDDTVDLWATVNQEKRPDDSIGPDEAMLAIRDNLGNMQHYYDMATEHMLKAFNHIRKAKIYMDANHISGYSRGGDRHDYGSILAIALGNINSARAEFSRKHRRDAWFQVFEQMQFRKWLDKKQTESFLRDVERNGNIPFTADNIKATLENVFLQRKKLFEQSVANVFDELCRYYKGNGNHTEGWKTNDSYKVNEKLIFPYGCRWCPIMGRLELDYRGAIDVYNDLDRIMCVLDGENFEECLTIGRALEYRFKQYGSKYDNGVQYSTSNNTCQSHYFDIRFFKKGTVHLTFRSRELWERFNVTASAGKKWIGENTQAA